MSQQQHFQKHSSEKLYTLVDKLKENGVSIIFISHRFEDMYHLASQLPYSVIPVHWSF